MAGVLVLALPLLSSCGFNKATDRVFTPGEGINNRDGVVDVLSAVVVSAQAGSGTFLASLSNNSSTDENSLEGLAGAGEWQDLTVDEVDPVDLTARGFANLAEEGGIHLSGNFQPGDVVRLTLTFSSGDSVTMNVPVIFACDEYTGLDTSGGEASSGSQPTESESPSPGEVPTDEASPSETAESSASSEETYDCAVVLEEE